jgi:hypothetical protein
MTYTDLEMNVLNILADNHGDEWQDHEGFCVDDFNEPKDFRYPHMDMYELTTDGTRQCGTIFSDYNLDPKVYRGVISSLLQKGAIFDDEYEAGTAFRPVPMIAIAITKETFDEIRKVAA